VCGYAISHTLLGAWSAFAFTLSDWAELRFASWHAEKMGEDDSQRVFALSKGELVRILQSFAPE
jgi:hypothetical protein